MTTKTSSQTKFGLLVLSGPASYFTGAAPPAHGDKRSLSIDDSNVIGRHPDASICIKDGAVARKHCEISWDSVGGQFRIADLESCNGTIVKDGQVFKNTLP